MSWKVKILCIVIFIFIFCICAIVFDLKQQSFILCYHNICEYKGGLKSLYVSPHTFERQMRFLKNRGYKCVSLKELVDFIKKKQIPNKIFAITFDDGYENFYTNAFEILKKYGFSATVFLTAGYIGKTHRYCQQPPEKHLNIKQIKELSRYVDFGAHSLTHPPLTQIPLNEVYKELIESKKIIQKITNKKVDLFCYPYGKYNEKIKELVKKSGYIAACSSQVGLINKKANLYSLPRIEFKEISAISPSYLLKNIKFYIKIFLGL